MRTAIYIDALNLYYGCLKKTPYKWLDLQALFSNILQETHTITHIKYFTTLIKPVAQDNRPKQRQETYIRALETHIPKISVSYGHFLRYKILMPRAEPPHKMVKVIDTEEKGADVNLSVHLLNDAWLDKYDCGVVVSNDSDMAEAMNLVKKHHEKILGLVTPSERTSKHLRKYADFVKTIRKADLKKSQLPNPIPNSNITKPKAWA